MTSKQKLKGHLWWDSGKWGTYTVQKHQQLIANSLKTTEE